jgi:hypothetical protein
MDHGTQQHTQTPYTTRYDPGKTRTQLYTDMKDAMRPWVAVEGAHAGQAVYVALQALLWETGYDERDRREIYTVETVIDGIVDTDHDTFDNLRDALVYAHTETSICERDHVAYEVLVFRKYLMAEYKSPLDSHRDLG